MNRQILIGYNAKDNSHKVILGGVGYPLIKEKFNEIKFSDEFSKVEIWSRSNGLEKSKRLKSKPSEVPVNSNPPPVDSEEIPESTESSLDEENDFDKGLSESEDE